MTLLPDADSGPVNQLSAYLQDITGALAAASTEQQVIEIVLTPAVKALGAVAGIVLLVDATDQQIKIAGSQGYENGTPTLWQEGSVEDHVLIADILRMKKALYFEDEGALKAAYPELESRTGGLAAVANAALPMFLDTRPFGIIVLDFTEPHHFSPAERRFLTILSGQCAIALGRAEGIQTLEARIEERTHQLGQERAAQDAFVAFTEAVGTEIDLSVLAQRAIQVMQAALPELGVIYYELAGVLWKPRAMSEEIPPEVAAVLRAGLPLETPSLMAAIKAPGPSFTEGWDAETEGVAHTESYGAGAFYPYFSQGQPVGLFCIGTQQARTWTTRDRAMFRAVGRSLGLALERTETARQLAAQNAELLARTQALEGFAALTHDLGLTTDAEVLIKRALSLVLGLLPPGYAIFWQISAGQWQVTAQLGDVGKPELQATLEAGFPVGQLPSLDLPYQTREPLFQDHYDHARDIAPELVEHVSTVATLPVMVGGKVGGILNVPLFGLRPWSVADQAVLRTTAHSLGLALERAEHARQLTAQRDLLQASNEELEAFTYSISHDLQTPVRHIVSFSTLLRRALPDVLDPKAERYFGIVTAAATTLGTLIDGMLDVSRASRQPLKPERVDLNRVFSAVRQQVEVTQPQREIVWQVGALPTLVGDAELLRRVVTALVDNAVKYTQNQEVAVITVWAEGQGQGWAVLVRDNGVGFNPQYAGKLFTMFQRLHRQEEFEGAAVSLANARRIVRRHGGTMLAEGQLGVGATFGFVLPKTAP